MLIIGVAALAASGCGGDDSGGGGGGTSDVLRMAVSEIDSPPDPDTYYGSFLLPVTRSAYQGLLRFKHNSPELEGVLATDWKKSADGLTYTFTLRDGVRFSDGTPFNAKAVQASFQRRIDLNSGATYMLSKVDSMSAPDPRTFVVRLSQPVSSFLSYLASPWGPLVSSPTAVKKHSKDGDRAAKWFETHTAGTGPYELTNIRPGARLVLEENPHYWGEPPHFTTINIAIIPEPATQRLELEGGSLDLVIRGLSSRDIDALRNAPCCQVKSFDKLQKTVVWVNEQSEIFSDPDVRAALRAALDNEELAKELDGPNGVPSTEFYPRGMLPDGAVPDAIEVDPSKLEAALAPLKGERVEIGAVADDLKTQHLADILQTRLQALGLKATTRKINGAEQFEMVSKASLRPDIAAFGELGPDSTAPDTWSQVFYAADAPANFLGCAVDQADALVEQAIAEPDDAKATELFVRSAELYRDSHCWMHIADTPDTIVARKGITGFDHELTGLLHLESLTEE